MNLFIDIETIPTTRADIRNRCENTVAPPGNYKSKEAIDKWWLEKGDADRNDAVGRTALDGTWGELLCVGWAINDGPVNITYRETTEARLLIDFGALLTSEAAPNAIDKFWSHRLVWIGHNLAAFDIRFLWQRYKVCNVMLPVRFPLERYPKGPYVYDTMTEWSGWNGKVKQTDLELAFGFTRTDPLERGGADVGAAHASGNDAAVKAHCFQDVTLLRQIYHRMNP